MIVSAALLAGAGLVLSGVIDWAALRVVKSFGDYAASNREQAAAIRLEAQTRDKAVSTMLALHESLQMVASDNAKVWAALQKAKRNGHEEVA